MGLLVLVAILAGMFVFVLARRVWRARVFRRLDRYRQHWLRRLTHLLAGEVPTPAELRSRESREALETILVDRLQTATGYNQELLSVVIEKSGLLDYRIEMLRRGPRWERLRSAALLGEMRSPAAVASLLEVMEDPWPLLRAAAIRSLGMIASPAAGPALLRAIRRGPPIEPNLWLDAAIACMPDPEAFLPLLFDPRPELRALGAQAIPECAHIPRFEPLQAHVFDSDPEVRTHVVRALGRTGDERAVDLLIAATRDPVWFVRQRALDALAQLNATAALGAVLCALRDPDFRVRQQAASTLAGMAANPAEVLRRLLGGRDRYALEGFVSELARAGLLWRSLPLLRSPDLAVRRYAEELLSCAVAAGNHHEVVHAVETHPEWRVRIAAARLLARTGNPSLSAEIRRRRVAASTARLRRVWLIILRAWREAADAAASPPALHSSQEVRSALAHLA